MPSLNIAIDGFDGVGKTTLINELRRHFSEKEVHIVKLLSYSVDSFKKFAYQNKSTMDEIDLKIRIYSYLLEAAIRIHENSKSDKCCIYIYDRWFISSYVDMGKVDYGYNSDFVTYLKKSIEPPDILFLLETDYEAIYERLIKKDDWMIYKYSKDLIKKKYSNFYRGYSEELAKLSLSACMIDAGENVQKILDKILWHVKNNAKYKMIEEVVRNG